MMAAHLQGGRRRRAGWRTAGLLAAIVAVGGCAKQGMPPGGPVDKTPPKVTRHAPVADATSVPTTAAITIEFSESMDRRRVEEAVFVAPHGRLQMDWSGRRLKLSPRGGLTPGRTYVVTVGTDARDLRGNRLEASYSFAFATGERLDSGRLQGRILSADDAPQRGAYVWAYDLATFGGRTARDEPAYVTQTGTDGTYAFERLARGRYRVVAFVDGDRDQAWDEGEPLALPPADVDVAGEGVTAAGDQRLARRGWRPRVTRAAAVDARRVLLTFDEAVDPGDLEIDLGRLAIEAVTADPADARRVHLRTATQAEGTAYRLRVRLDGQALEVPEEDVRGTARSDSKRPAVLRVEPAGSVVAAPSVRFVFSEAMDPARTPPGWVATDSTTTPAGTWSWAGPVALDFVPDSAFAVGAHRLVLDLGGLTDLAGNAPADSVAAAAFEVLAPATWATVTGVSRWPGEPEGGPGVARVRLTAATSVREAAVDSAGRFGFSGLAPGEYRATAWFDRDGDGAWDPGDVDYRAAEPYVLHGKVRPGPGETVSLALPLPPAATPPEAETEEESE